MKIIYASDRKAHVTNEQFVRRWRFHGALAMMMPSFFGTVVRYVHNDGATLAEPIAGLTFFDAVGELFYDSITDCGGSMGSPELQSSIMLDGDEVFDRAKGITAAVDDKVLFSRNPGAFSIFSFVERDAGADADTFRLRWMTENEASVGGLLDTSRGRSLAGAIVSSPVDIGIGLSEIDGVLQLNFDDLTDGAELYRMWRDDIEARMAAGGGVMCITSVITRPCVLYDRAHTAP